MHVHAGVVQRIRKRRRILIRRVESLMASNIKYR